MGQKLNLPFSDSLFDVLRTKPVGFSGGCYCCGQQIHVSYTNLNVLPNARISGDLYQILICDNCETDVHELEEEGIESVSYDVLFQLQEDLQVKLNEIGEMHTVEDEDRFEILKKLYLRFEERYKKLKG